MNTKWKVISSLMLLIVCICSSFVYLFIQHTQETLHRCVDKQIESLHSIVGNLETEKTRYYQTRIRNFIDYKLDPGREDILQAFAAQNRAELLRLSTPYFNRAQSEDPFFTTMAWILPDNHNFLRVHDPKRKGDDISALRSDIVLANRDKQQRSGYIIARSGLRYGVVEPVFYKGEYLGALQFGMNESAILQSIEEQLPLTVGLLIPNEKYVPVTTAALPAVSGKIYTLQSRNLPFFEGKEGSIDWTLARQELLLQGREHVLVKALDLLDHEGQVLGRICAAMDIADFVREARAKVFFSIFLGVLLFTASFVVLYFSYGSLLENIITLNRSLLRKTEEWEKTFDSMSDIVTVQDKSMLIVQANRAARIFFQNEKETIIGRKCFEIFQGTTAPCQGCPAVNSLQDTKKHSETIVHKCFGKIFYVSSAPIHDEEGDFQYLVHTAKDITEQKKLEDELFQARKMEAIGTLAGGIAHDFNNILSAIIGYSQLAKLNISQPDRVTADIDEVLKAGRRATDLVKQILNISRKSKQQQTSFEPYLIVKEALKMLRSSLPTSIAIRKNIDSHCGSILADPTNLHQIVVNLCTNAFHAMEDEQGVLEVSLQRKELGAAEIGGDSSISPGSFIVLEVSDTGRGMDEAEQAHIFEPYFTTKEPGKGTGLGLALIHDIIQAYHGFIRVQSAPGKGSTFSVYIPAVSLEVASPLEEPGAEEALPTGNERILIVDDEIAIAEMLKIMLETSGYRVSTTAKSTEALEKIQADPHQFDLIITDQTMPDLTGAELARKVLHINDKLPVILCTGYSSTLSRKDALAIGIKKYINKPVDRTTLITTVRKILDACKDV